MLKLISSLLALCIVVSGCSTTYKIPEQSLRDSPYPTSSRIKADSILINKPYSGFESVSFAVLKIESGHKPKEQRAFLEHALNDLGISEVVSEEELVRKILTEGLDLSVSSTSDLLSLNKLSKALGNFLLIDWTTEFMGNAIWKTEFTVIDPSVPEKILEVKETDTVWMNFDAEFTYPIVNLLRELLYADLAP